jgi:hypothetical protein
MTTCRLLPPRKMLRGCHSYSTWTQLLLRLLMQRSGRFSLGRALDASFAFCFLPTDSSRLHVIASLGGKGMYRSSSSSSTSALDTLHHTEICTSTKDSLHPPSTVPLQWAAAQGSIVSPSIHRCTLPQSLLKLSKFSTTRVSIGMDPG